MKPGATDQLVSIVLPVHNQGDHIERIVEAYEEALTRVPAEHEFVLVINNCTDNSLEVCQSLAARFPSVRVVECSERGWGAAVRYGLDRARGDLLCYTNSARTGTTDLVLLVLYAIANPGAVVKAHRRSRESLTRKLGSFLFNLECRVLFDLPTWDINATPKVFSRKLYQDIRPTSSGDLIDLEVYAACKRQNAVILEVPVYASSRRHGGTSTTNYGSAVRMYLGALAMRRSMSSPAEPPIAASPGRESWNGRPDAVATLAEAGRAARVEDELHQS